LETIAEKNPLKREVAQNEVATTSLYLLSDLSKGVTGQVIYVDGGYSIMGL
jgi:enoyl-[acyl-carrier protein] reductase I